MSLAKPPEHRSTDDAISETLATVMVIALVVVLAAIIGALVMGFGSNIHKPTLTGFAHNAYRDSSGCVTAIEFHAIAGDVLNVNKTGTGQGLPLNNTKFVVVDPTGKNYDVRLHNMASGNRTIAPGVPFYLFSRQQTYFYLSDNSTNMVTGGGAGGGGGGGGGSGNGKNVPLTSGLWTFRIIDAQNTNQVIYEGQVRV